VIRNTRILYGVWIEIFTTSWNWDSTYLFVFSLLEFIGYCIFSVALFVYWVLKVVGLMVFVVQENDLLLLEVIWCESLRMHFWSRERTEHQALDWQNCRIIRIRVLSNAAYPNLKVTFHIYSLNLLKPFTSYNLSFCKTIFNYLCSRGMHLLILLSCVYIRTTFHQNHFSSIAYTLLTVFHRLLLAHLFFS